MPYLSQCRSCVALALCVVFGAVTAARAGQAPADIPEVIRALRHQPPSSNQSADEPSVSFLPTLRSNPAIGVSVGTLMSFAVRRGGPDSRVSSAQASIAFTTESQVIGALRNGLRSRDDKWSLVGDSRLAKFQQQAPILGTDVPADAFTADLRYNWIRFYQTAYRKVRGPLPLGLGYHLDSFMNIRPDGDDDADSLLPDDVADELSVTTVTSGLSLDALFASLDNPLNPEHGFYGRASYYDNPVFLGSDRDWDSLQLEACAYLLVPGERRQVLAIWMQSWQTREGQPPYFSLPSPGWDTYGRSGRGYAAGLLRGRDWGYGEAEYGLDLMRNGLVGMVGFVSASTLSDCDGDYGEWAVGGGTGVRVKLSKRYGTNIAMDVAWGRDGKVGVWFGLNEAF